jgi:hypothetical protein
MKRRSDRTPAGVPAISSPAPLVVHKSGGNKDLHKDDGRSTKVMFLRSRGSSEATPPDMRSVIEADTGGVAAALHARPAPQSDQERQPKISCAITACRTSCAAGTPAGVRSRFRSRTGGIASLNPRLIAATPAGVEMEIASQRCPVEVGRYSQSRCGLTGGCGP